MSSDSDDGYVHTPAASDDLSASDDASAGDDSTVDHTSDGPTDPSADPTDPGHGNADPADGSTDGLGRTGWVLVGVVVTATVVVPGIIYLFPAAPGEAGLPFLIAMLALPFLPAVLLGVTAVWSLAATGE